MLFNSYLFTFVFLPITLLVFLLLGRRGFYQSALGWLVAASFFFYGWWNPSSLILLTSSISFNYGLGILLTKMQREQKSNSKFILTIGVVVNLSLLAYFKYTDFIILSVNNVFNTNYNLQHIILPLGVSFFTFNQIAYLVDASRGAVKEYNFFKYCLFVTFFPHLIAGPIVHHKELIPQFEKLAYGPVSNNLIFGSTIFIIGLFKKTVIADSLATPASLAFKAVYDGTSLGLFDAWIGVLSYTLQLYFDFSGYCDMAIGAALMFGICFPLNFNSPYKAVNIIDFWKRWHITLSQFLRDYIYIPLGGNRKGQFRRYLNLMITMLLGGLWHGAGWTFVIWGGLHGIYLVINHAWHALRRALGQDLNQSSWWSRGLAQLVTFLAVIVAWIFFRAESLPAALLMLEGMIGLHGVTLVKFSDQGPLGLSILFGSLLICWFAPNTQEWLAKSPIYSSGTIKNNLPAKWQWKPTTGFAIVVGIMAGLAIMYMIRPTEFLYFQF
ncbi:MBOAT family O-acyltransferase [Anthocerotibacter panamensis]|uniref:MBOAT family O-acyltransferase n=1 Tax=Anthocerotibacter panamensis TaxID=2857077 RepID=UPI001C4039D3|nr:MBOAT family protein [Anthocerotibacter panamensis]